MFAGFVVFCLLVGIGWETVWRLKPTQVHLGWGWSGGGIRKGKGEGGRQLGRGRSQCGNVCPDGDSFLKDDVGVSQQSPKTENPQTACACSQRDSL